MLKERLNRALISVLELDKCEVQASLAGIDLEPVCITSSNRPRFGDFSSSLPLKLAGSDGAKALAIAQDLALRMRALKESNDLIEELSVVAPGYLNFHLHTTCLAQVLGQIHREKRSYGQSSPGQRALFLENHQLAAAIGFDPGMIGPTSRRDPVEFMRYVYARCMSLLRLAQEEYPNTHEGRIDPPPFDKAEWQKLQKLFATECSIFEPAFVSQGERVVLARTLVLRLDSMSSELEHWENANDSLRLGRYAYEVATGVEEFRQTVRFQTEERALLAAALGVLSAGCQVLSNLGERIGVALP
ncbi:MAG: hypothetical protein C5B53_12210 [Candidatus Melainabacteria bacterium]|nr:MAG: hypothetical protein C5B53_12210 [Candidatus Melainabacteria bacterium]